MRAPLTISITSLTLLVTAWPATARTVNFAKEVLPVFQRACFECHGPELQKSGLRLDTREGAFKNAKVIVRGQAGRSELYRRIVLPKGHEDAMPNRGEPLSRGETEVIREWIDAGADWPADAQLPRHWAYAAPTRPALPVVANSTWPRNEVDRFILARLEQEGLRPAPEANRATLLRRVSLDLTGLPPSPEETGEFLADKSPNAWEKVVDRLLRSGEFGVRWARPWLDYARYADSHGFQRDDFRDVWAYRDWVVNALNADMPYDRFSIEQLAGDLIPNATETQRIATGFNRNAPTNVEAGTEPEETRVNQIFDRINTLATIWLGSTMECAQCHDHKYDPFSIKDYYGLFAFFNHTELEADRTNPRSPGSIQFKGVTMPLGEPATGAKRTRLEEQIAALDAELAEHSKQYERPDAKWEAVLRERLAEAPREQVLELASFESTKGAGHEILPDKSVLLLDDAPDQDVYVATVRTAVTGIRGIKLEALTHPSLPGGGPGRGDAARPNFVLNEFRAEIIGADGKFQAVRFTDARAGFAQKNYDPKGSIDTDPKSGWAINPKFHQPHWAVFETAGPLGAAAGVTLRFTLTQSYGGARTIGRLRLSAVTGNVPGESLPADVAQALETEPAKRSRKLAKALADFRAQGDAELGALRDRRAKLAQELKALPARTTLVMRELPEPRDSFLFMRGAFTQPGPRIAPAVPAVLHPMADRHREFAGGPIERDNRLVLAQWLLDRRNPLAARVAVNRLWAEIFGQGLVTTPEDFGLKGEPPTHPELLDWLAVEFMDRGWSLKQILKTLVMSATYRQSSRTTPAQLAADDRNQFHARGPRFRMDAEMIRDNALAIAGLVSLAKGGPPIKPYQPDGLWVKVGGQRYDYVVSPGESKFRRGLYVVLKRGAPYPSFVNFDANNRMACRVQRVRSNTPLQALTLLNDPVYVEAATGFARRVLTERATGTDEERIRHALRLALVRDAKPLEVATLKRLLVQQRVDGMRDSRTAGQFAAESTLPAGVTAAEFAAWYAVTAAILNLDETITKE